MDASFRDWGVLPAHILDIVVAKLDLVMDYVCFSGVCPQWRFVALEAKVDHKVSLDVLKASRKKLPMLIFKTNENNDGKMSLYSVSDKETYSIKLPLPYKYRFAGSSLGWLFCVEKTMAVTLVNPYNNGCISLPVFKDPNKLFSEEWQSKLFDFYITKGILLSDPHVNPDSFVVVVFYGGMSELAFFKSGDPVWNFINSEIEFLASDIIYYKGKLYGADLSGEFVEIDLGSKTIKTIVPPITVIANRVYLVESHDGELLMVQRWWFSDMEVNQNDEVNHVQAEQFVNADYDDGDFNHLANEINLQSIGDLENFPKSIKFKVFKMTHPIEEGSATWVKVDSIGEQALFVGDNHSVCVSTTKFPGCLPNSIYYVSDHHNTYFSYTCLGLNEDSGIFNLNEGSFSSHHELESSSRYMHPPIWFVPKPQ